MTDLELGAPHSDRIFRERIVPDELTGTSNLRPVLVVVAGQPGDGKAPISASASAALGRRGRPVTLDPVRYEPYHPRFHELTSGAHPAADRPVAADSRRWLARAEAYAISQRFDVVLESAVTDPAGLLESVRRFRAAGYQVEIAFLAVSAAMSRFGLFDRELRALEAYGYSPATTVADHDAGYAGVLRAAEAAEHAAYADRVGVYRPDGTLIYGNQRAPDGDWQQPPRAVDAITWERDRPWTVLESRLFLTGLRDAERIGLSAPLQWVRERTVRLTGEIGALARPRLHPDAVTLHIATAGLPRPDAT